MTHKLVCLQMTSTAEVREETLDDRVYLVAPVVMAMAPSVLNGELLTVEDLLDVPVKSWSDIPIPISHPRERGFPVSASDLDKIKADVCGRIYEPVYVTQDDESVKLKAEMWIDVEKATSMGVDGEVVVQKLRDGEMLEVSTGYFCDVIPESGTLDGERYSGRETKIRPDHLAVLPNEIGACSVADGCGAPRVNATEGGTMLRVQGESYREREDRVLEAIREQIVKSSDEWVYVADLYESEVVFCQQDDDGNETYFRAPYTMSGETVEIGEPVAVEREVSYTVKANVRSAARTPSYSGTESTSWSKPSLGKFIDGYVKHTGKERPESETVSDLPAAVKAWIASKTLLGESGAEELRDLIFFPVVNPSTDKLNENALRAVLGGRGSQADISEDAVKSAQAKARALLEKEFDMERTTANACDEKLIQRIIRRVGKAITSMGVNSMDRKTMLATLKDGGVDEELLTDNMTDEQLAWMVEHLPATNEEDDDPPPPPPPPPAKPEDEDDGEEEVPAPTANQLTPEMLADMEIDGVKLGEVVQYAKERKEAATSERTHLIDALVANSRVTMSKESLEAMPVSALQELAANFQVGNFLGAAIPRTNQGEEIPRSPAVVLAKAGE